MQEAQNWRELLKIIISDNKEKQRIIDDLKISQVTLTRWINAESEPRPQNMRLLVGVLSQHYREQMLALLKKEKGLGNLFSSMPNDIPVEIPTDFYMRILSARATTGENMRFWSTCNLILPQALGQLDPDRLGMSIWIVRCMPPSGLLHKVQSLREMAGLGNPPWSGNLDQKGMFLGAESLAGHVVTLCRPGIIQNLDEEHLMPASRVEHEKSAAIFPILYAGRIAGVFLVSSTQYNYFLLQSRTTLVQKYADLAALAFEVDDFYPPEQIALSIMPSHDEQKPFFAHFRQMVADQMVYGASKSRPINNIEADQIVWQQLEQQLLQSHIQKNK